MGKQRRDDNYYRRRYARRGIVIIEPQINTGNSFATLEEQSNRKEGITKPSSPGEGEAEGGPGHGKGGGHLNPNR